MRTDAKGDVYIGFGEGHFGISNLGEISIVRKVSGVELGKTLWEYAIQTTQQAKNGNIDDMAVLEDGSVAYVGTDVSTSSDTVIVGKISADGDATDWEDKWTAEFDAQGKGVVIGTDGGIYAAGNALGVISDATTQDGEEVTGGPWLARYEPDGTRTFLKQFDDNNEGESLIADGRGGLIYYGQNFALGFDEGGRQTLAKADPRAGVAEANPNTVPAWFGRMTFANDGVYALAPCIIDPRDLIPRHVPSISVYDSQLNLQWIRAAEADRKGTLDDGSEWRGFFGSDTSTIGGGRQAFAVDGSGIYIVYFYENSYSGSSPNVQAIFVAKYDLDGDRVWFEEFELEGSDGKVTVDVYSSLEKAALVLDSEGNPIVGVNTGNINAGGDAFLFRLSASDGRLL